MKYYVRKTQRLIGVGAFDLLSEEIVDVLDELDIVEETRPQEAAIPPILDGENSLVIAPTGIGKTEAAVLPLLEKILGRDVEGNQVIYITPLKALNRDMVRRMEEFSQRLDFSVGVRHGDTTRKERRKQAEDPPDLLITTPETLQIMFTGRKLRKGLKGVRHVVVDELNELAEDERGSQLSLALEKLVELTERNFQRIGLSATVGSPERVLNFLVGMGREGRIIEVSGRRELDIEVEEPEGEEGDERLAEQMKCEPEKAKAVRRCKELIDQHESTLFFVNTRDAAESLASCFKLWDEDYPIGVHHGSLSKEARIDVEERFKEGDLKAIICTSSMELGIDLGETDFVLQYQSPRQVIRWVQRVGRSGHKIGEVSHGRIITSVEDDIAEAGVIARRAKSREIEKTAIPEEPLSVLANQMIAAVHTEKSLDMKRFYETAVRAYPFRDLDFEDYKELVEQLAEIKVIWKEEDEIGKRRASLDYFYDNISMIPDEKTFLMKDSVSQNIIGTLDESFVASKGEIGGIITLQGRAWRIVDIEDDEVMVNPVKDLGKIPDWSGQDIPVPFEVAQEVGRLREEGWVGGYPVGDGTKLRFEKYVEDQKDYPIPGADKIVVEIGKDTTVVNACFGSQVNQTFGRLLAALLSTRVGETMGLQTDPYRIMMKTPRMITPDMFEDIFYDTDPEVLRDLLKKSLINSSFFRWKFLHVAKKFGAVEKDVDYRTMNLDRLIDAFEDTPLYHEALEKTLRDNMDLERTRELLRRIQRDEIEIIFSRSGVSPIGETGLEKHKELLNPDRASRAILMSLKERLESEKVIMKCLKCGNRRRKRVEDVDKPSCPVCGSSMVAPMLPYQDAEILDKDEKELDEEGKKKLQEYYKLAEMARVYGKRAAMALVARGVGHQNAARILNRDHPEEEEFLRDILEAEIRYARTKQFWD